MTEDTAATEVVSVLIRNWITPVVKSRGYLGRAPTWRKANGPFIHVINVQRRRGNNWTNAEFYLNACVYVRALDEMLRAPVLTEPKEYHGHVRLRPNKLPGSMPQSLIVTSGTDVQAFGPTVAANVTALIDAMEGFATVDDVVDYLSHRLLEQYEQVFGWYLHAGRMADARVFVAGLHERFGDQTRWKIFARKLEEVAAHLGFRSGDIAPIPKGAQPASSQDVLPQPTRIVSVAPGATLFE